MFKIGQKVVCVNDKIRHIDSPLGNLKKNKIYTVAKIEVGCLWLEEIKAPATGHYYKDRFMPLKYDIISNKEIIKAIIIEKSDLPIKEPVLNRRLTTNYLSRHEP